MGLIDDAEVTAQAGVTKVTRAAQDSVDRLKDDAAQAGADAKVKKAEAERDSVDRRIVAKDALRGN